ncbi:flagellar assembly factor FliW [Jatrophihabitans endophyticus]|uniref:Flagellar assembly factor FliW n=1 Tax=Jatrophihabitans endophyticus TaxID=1206085 RepID=A0A1M5IEW0_9ACTN|nr:flagellar assembly protein FliW [Jatrophihabitans endophyticus]SHG26460.1 flagellar assembly factor FliW [Jatrophihabitans endophyticus]
MTTSVLSEPTTASTVRLVEPLPGFDDELDFTLIPIDPDGVLLAMRSMRNPGLRFVLTPAECFFEGYRPALGDAVATALGAASEADLRVLLVLTIAGDLTDATVNLRAPVIMARGGSAALQVVLDDETLSMHQPLLPTVAPH